MQEGSRVALVHDFLVDVRGAERVFLALCDLFPQADVFTAVYDEEGTEGRFAHRAVHTSYLQRLRPSARTFRALLPLYPAAMESLATQQPGYRGFESTRGSDGLGITLSFWADNASALRWRDHPEHAAIREAGRDRWYEHYEVIVCEAQRSYAWQRPGAG